MFRILSICSVLVFVHILFLGACASKAPSQSTGTITPNDKQTEEFFQVLKDVRYEWDFIRLSGAGLHPEEATRAWTQQYSKIFGGDVTAQRTLSQDPRAAWITKDVCQLTGSTREKTGTTIVRAQIGGKACPISYADDLEMESGQTPRHKQKIDYSIHSKAMQKRSKIAGFHWTNEMDIHFEGGKEDPIGVTTRRMQGRVELPDGRAIRVATSLDHRHLFKGGRDTETTQLEFTAPQYTVQLKIARDGGNTTYSLNGRDVSEDWITKHAGGPLTYLPWGWIAAPGAPRVDTR